jgi:hypothetical protein
MVSRDGRSSRTNSLTSGSTVIRPRTPSRGKSCVGRVRWSLGDNAIMERLESVYTRDGQETPLVLSGQRYSRQYLCIANVV